jgi:hypothetical protein
MRRWQENKDFVPFWSPLSEQPNLGLMNPPQDATCLQNRTCMKVCVAAVSHP